MNLASRIVWRLRRSVPYSLSRTEPVSRAFGYDRGTPVDRHYIEQFLTGRQSAVRGRTLEVGDDSYTRVFGADRTTQRETIHIDPANAAASYHGDMSSPGILPIATFDCAVITQTLHLIYDMHAAVRHLHASLVPGGTLLLTVPGLSQIAGDEWGKTWFWSLTQLSAARLLSDVFGEQNVTVRTYGNVFAATAFLHGLAVEEIDQRKLGVVDPLYPVIVAAAATRR